MRKSFFVKLIILSVIAIAPLFFYFHKSSTQNQNKTSGNPALLSSEFNKTVVTSYLQHKIEKGKNLVFCSTFQLTWNKLIDDVIKEPIQLQDDLPVVDFLNERLTNEEDISDADYLAMVGLRKDNIVKKIQREMMSKFGRSPGFDFRVPKLAPMIPGESFVSYSFLMKRLEFKEEFDPLYEPLLFNDNYSVEAFGIENYTPLIAGQVTVLDYVHEDDFIISLKTKSVNDKLILAKVIPEKRLLDTIDAVFDRIGQKYPRTELEEEEPLKIPKITIDVLHSYQEISRKFFLNKGFENYYVGRAVQMILFSLDEKGIILESSALYEPYYLSSSFDQPRSFIFDKPFLLCLIEKGAKYPYFVLWVDNDELLIEQESIYGSEE